MSMDGMGWEGFHRSSKSTFGANNKDSITKVAIKDSHNPEVCFRIDVAACPIVEGNCGSVSNHIETGKSKKHFHPTSFAAID